MMNFTLTRTYQPDVTLGILTDDLGNEVCKTLELPWLDNQPEVSCIIEGTYNAIEFTSPHLGLVYRLFGVPNRSLIDIHPGNTVDDLRGCIAVGIEYGELSGKPAVLNSKIALSKLMALAGEKLTLTITTNGE